MEQIPSKMMMDLSKMIWDDKDDSTEFWFHPNSKVDPEKGRNDWNRILGESPPAGPHAIPRVFLVTSPVISSYIPNFVGEIPIFPVIPL